MWAKLKQKIIILLVLLVLVARKNVFAQTRSGYGKPLASYTGNSGITITSYASRWDTPAKLGQIYKELLSNEYGEELAFLQNIYIYPDSPEGVLAYTHYDLKRNYFGHYSYHGNTYIEIFDGNQYETIEDMAWVLSHEYGHHFTIYYLVNKEGKFFDQWAKTGYARARNISNHPHINYESESIGASYEWDIMEIAAEDYVQIFGSPNAKRSIFYKDIQQKTQDKLINSFNYKAGFNMKPQENLELPLAADVEGLEAYWRDLANLPQKTKIKIPAKPKLRLVTKKEIRKGYYQYRIEWDEIPDNKTYEYTLVGYLGEEYGFPYPIKTVRLGEKPYAIIGNGLKVDRKTGSSQLIIDDYQGSYTFSLYIKDANNRLYRSSPFKVNFNYPIIDKQGIYKDMHPTDWSYDASKQLHQRKIMVGSPDLYFYPLKGVTYPELIDILRRIEANYPKLKLGTVPKMKLDSLKENQSLTRDDIALVLCHYITSRGIGPKEVRRATTFKDQANIINSKEVDCLYKTGLISGLNGYYYPQNDITRQELASIIIRLLQLTII